MTHMGRRGLGFRSHPNRQVSKLRTAEFVRDGLDPRSHSPAAGIAAMGHKRGRSSKSV